jgi:hypothetical protein
MRLAALLLFPAILVAQSSWFLGAGPGYVIHSIDASAGPSRASFYQTANAPQIHFFAGAHLHDYLSLQGAYSRNRHGAILWRPPDPRIDLRFTQHEAGADLMLYFRNRRSWARPYLSAGLGMARFRGLDTTCAGLRVAAGLELLHSSGWGFRYAFLETISANPLGELLVPPGRKNLMTFQNQFGLVKYF